MDEITKRPQQPRPKDNFKDWEAPLYNDLRRIFSRSRLREVLTHSSFYEKEGRGNSRYVFAGMFVFKGMVAQVLYRYYTGEGTRLQHVLGNLFRNERLERMFDELKLSQFVRAGEKFDVKSHRHIFMYAVFGYVSTLDENTRNWFIGKYILNGESEYVFLHKKRNSNLLAQADEMVRRTDGRRLGIEMEETEEGLHRAKAVLSDGTLLCEAESKSWRYARTKVTKLALNILATPFRKEMLSNPDYHARILAREEEKREKRKAEVEARDAAKEALRAEKMEQRKAEARARDAKRRKSQAEAKKRKAENAVRAAAKAAKEARPMSAKKRRFLEDKKK
ncbi:MAG: hypothetical protein IJR87_10410 [Bacteroidaceae bacterium]|nr:hypothetical protein [Bacteroidaceae bacterium]